MSLTMANGLSAKDRFKNFNYNH